MLCTIKQVHFIQTKIIGEKGPRSLPILRIEPFGRRYETAHIAALPMFGNGRQKMNVKTS